MKRSIVDYIAEHAVRSPDRVAIHHRDKKLSYGELVDAAARCRGALGARGIRPGDRVALVMSDSPQMVIAFLAIIGIGAIAVPCSTMLPPEGLSYVFKDSDAKLVIVSPEHLGNAQKAGVENPILADELLKNGTPAPLGEFDRDTPCLVLYTSGSTGQPKGAVHRHGHMPWTVESVARKVYDLQPDDRVFSVPRLFFAYGLGNSLSIPLGTGASTILVSERPTPALIAEVFEKYRPTVFFAVPTVFRMLLEHARQGNRIDAASIKFSVSAGEVLPVATWNEWKALTGSEILDTIGTTELLHAFIHNYRDRNRAGSSGVVLEGYEVKLTDESGAEVSGAGRGYLHVRGGSAISYYLNKPEKTAETIRDGWVRTGDVYRRDEDGYYWFEGRGDDLFKCSGLWVTPGEVEEAVCRHPAVTEAAVIAEKDANGGTIPAAYVLLRPGYSPGEALSTEIREEAAKTLPRYKRPQRVHFMRELPRTPTGKVQRFKLRQMAAANSATGP
ncbi:MAG TPA: benzoate-CoA ligase family protein [Burkholderiales bacterium]|nr:benzoate-CoA ligase family protein [Burkholderiales bacterium]